MVFNGLYFYKEFKTLGIQSKQQTSLIMTSYIGFSSTKPASRRHFAERKECFFFGGGGGFGGLRVPSLKVEGSEELALYRFWPLSIWTPTRGP